MKSSVTLKEKELVRDTLASFLLHVKQRIDPRNIKDFTLGLSIKGCGFRCKIVHVFRFNFVRFLAE